MGLLAGLRFRSLAQLLRRVACAAHAHARAGVAVERCCDRRERGARVRALHLVGARAVEAAVFQNGAETILAVEGMTCSSCIRHVEHALRELSGVAKVAVNLKDGKVRCWGENNEGELGTNTAWRAELVRVPD